MLFAWSFSPLKRLRAFSAIFLVAFSCCVQRRRFLLLSVGFPSCVWRKRRFHLQNCHRFFPLKRFRAGFFSLLQKNLSYSCCLLRWLVVCCVAFCFLCVGKKQGVLLILRRDFFFSSSLLSKFTNTLRAARCHRTFVGHDEELS